MALLRRNRKGVRKTTFRRNTMYKAEAAQAAAPAPAPVAEAEPEVVNEPAPAAEAEAEPVAAAAESVPEAVSDAPVAETEPEPEAATETAPEAEAELTPYEGSAKEPEAETIGSSADSVFRFFREISAIPRGSHHTEQISDYLVAFAKKRSLSYVQDDTGNVIITKKASVGFEKADPIAMQGHIDMVLASEPDKKIDMLKEPVTILTEGDWMFADGTTLGADNGIAVAMMLAVLDDDTICHPLLECIFTSDEEVGLIGANAIDLSGLKSRRLLNLDSEEEGVFCAGCAGGAEVVCEMPLKRKNREGNVLRVKIAGLSGGHSGSDIHLGGANANRLLARALYMVNKEVPFRLMSIGGGDADNAIPTNAEASILVQSKDDLDLVSELFKKAGEVLAAEYKVTDPGMRWSIFREEKTEKEETETGECISKKKTTALLEYMLSLPTGVTQMSPVIKGMPQTSLNLGIVRTFEDHLLCELMVRSGINSQTAFLSDRVVCITKGFGGTAAVRSSYPAWEFKKDSPFRELAVSAYTELTGKKPKVEVIHAGLECGILSGKLPDLDCVSTGPNLQNVHTVRERMSISSVRNVWEFVLALLKKAAEEE